jgi:hypothetical protein
MHSDFLLLIFCSKLLETLFVLLASPLTASNHNIFHCVKDIIEALMQTLHGLVFVASNLETANGLIKLLLQTGVSLRSINITPTKPSFAGVYASPNFFGRMCQQTSVLQSYHLPLISRALLIISLTCVKHFFPFCPFFGEISLLPEKPE